MIEYSIILVAVCVTNAILIYISAKLAIKWKMVPFKHLRLKSKEHE